MAAFFELAAVIAGRDGVVVEAAKKIDVLGEGFPDALKGGIDLRLFDGLLGAARPRGAHDGLAELRAVVVGRGFGGFLKQGGCADWIRGSIALEIGADAWDIDIQIAVIMRFLSLVPIQKSTFYIG